MNLKQKASKIKAVVLDIDGVLTNGLIGYSGISGEEIKFFHVRDGHGIKLAKRAGLKVGALSGRTAGPTKNVRPNLSLIFCMRVKKTRVRRLKFCLKSLT